MPVHRLSWPTASRGAQVVPALLIAGLPHLIVPGGVVVSSVAWTDAADTAWHATTSPTTRAWLDLGAQAPELRLKERASPVQGTLEVSDLTFNLLDVAGEVVRLFNSPNTPFALLKADASASATSLTVDAINMFASAGVVHLGRERVTYTSKTSTSGGAGTLNGCTRGTAGTKAQPYTASARHRVYAAPSGIDVLLSTVGRRVTLWMLHLSAGVATDPTLVYDGRGFIGGGLTQDGAAWELPTRSVLKELAEKSAPPRVTLYGYAHPEAAAVRTTSTENESSSDMTPLAVWWMPSSGAGACVILGSAAAPDPDNGGWHATRDTFLTAWNAAATALGLSIRAGVAADGRCRVEAADGTGRRLGGKFGWSRQLTDFEPDNRGDTATQAAIVSADPMPPACVWLHGAVHLAPSDLAQIPSLPSALSDSVTAYWTLSAKRENAIYPAATLTGQITAVGASTVTVNTPEVAALGPGGVLLAKPTAATVGLSARGPRWYTALRYGVFDQVDGLRGLDWLGDSIDWAKITSTALVNPGIGASARDLYVDLAAPLLDLLKNEARLLGAALVTHHGRVAFGVFRALAPTHPRVANLTAANLRAGALPASEKSPDGLLTSFALTLADTGDVIRTVDQCAVKESGEGEEIEATAPRGCLPQGVETERIFETVTGMAINTLAPFARPYHVVTLPVTLAHAFVELGDVVGVDEWMLPTSDGGRGLGTQGTVIGRSLNFATGEVDLEVMVSVSPVYGYAPEALVSSIAGAVLTLNTTTCGAHGFADTYQDDGVTLRTDGGANTFTPGDKVQLLEMDTETPATPFDGEVLSVSGATVTLTASPGATWATRASSGLVMLAFAPWTTAISAQKRWAFVADDASNELSDGTPARRYA